MNMYYLGKYAIKLFYWNFYRLISKKLSISTTYCLIYLHCTHLIQFVLLCICVNLLTFVNKFVACTNCRQVLSAAQVERHSEFPLNMKNETIFFISIERIVINTLMNLKIVWLIIIMKKNDYAYVGIDRVTLDIVTRYNNNNNNNNIN